MLDLTYYPSEKCATIWYQTRRMRLNFLKSLLNLSLALQKPTREKLQSILQPLRRHWIGLDRLLQLLAIVGEIVYLGAGELLINACGEKGIDFGDLG